MEEKDFNNYFKDFEKYSLHNLKLKNRNGELDEIVRFEGLDNNMVPILIQTGGVRLEIGKLDYGYSSVKFISEEHPDGIC